MTGGINGETLRVNLCDKTFVIEEISKKYVKDYLGGDGLGSKILYDEVMPGVDALEPDNRLIVAAGPLCGTHVQSACTHSLITKSPITGFTIITSRCNGYFGPRLKFSGYDALVIEGASSNPVILFIDDGIPRFIDASDTWGKGVRESCHLITKRLGKTEISIDCIGPAGENQVPIACVVSDNQHVAARGGVGAVMGSKKLKAIAVCGTKKVIISDKDRFSENSKLWRKMNMESPSAQVRAKYGTAGSLGLTYGVGDLPIRNFTTGILAGYEKLTGEYIIDKHFYKHETCFSCTLAHNKKIKIRVENHDEIFELPEYECLAAWGSNIGSTDLIGVVRCTDACDDNGIDSLEASTAISMVMECVEKGLLKANDLDGIELKFGNWESALQMIHKIAKKDGFGKILAEGGKRAAEFIGHGAENFVAHVKGMSIPMHDFRALWGYALQYAVGSAGPSHEGGPAGREIAGELDRFSVEKKGEAVMEGQKVRCIFNNIGVCHFGTLGVPLEVIVNTLSAALGYDISVEEVKKISMRCVNLRRAFNLRHGLKPEHDTLSARLLEAPPDGAAKGSKIKIKPMVRDYYRCMGWDEKTGKPYRSTLKELGLENVLKDIWK
jgi:aldehyde:ferredoxin oxidoreductase